MKPKKKTKKKNSKIKTKKYKNSVKQVYSKNFY